MTLPAMELGDETPTALYRLYGAEGKLLYVGISGDLKTRFAAHAAVKPWWPDVARRTVEWHLRREDAAEAEVRAIGLERPAHNIRDAKSARRELRNVKVTGAAVFDLALTKMPPMTLRLRLLELAGFSTREALDVLGVQPTHRHRVLAGRTGGKPSSR